MTDDLHTYSDVGETAITVSGEQYKLVPLRPVDVADAQDFINSLQRRQFWQDCRTHPYSESVTAETLSRMACHRMSLTDLLNDWKGRIKLLQLSLVRGGQKMTYEHVRDNMDPIVHDQLIEVLVRITGLRPDKDGDNPPTLPDNLPAARTGNE